MVLSFCTITNANLYCFYIFSDVCVFKPIFKKVPKYPYKDEINAWWHAHKRSISKKFDII